MRTMTISFNNQVFLSLNQIFLAELCKDYILYYKNAFCYRLRVYPLSHLFSRITGCFRYLVCSKAHKLTLVGLKLMVLNYYQGTP